jgi:hypothetical protein
LASGPWVLNRRALEILAAPSWSSGVVSKGGPPGSIAGASALRFISHIARWAVLSAVVMINESGH